MFSQPCVIPSALRGLPRGSAWGVCLWEGWADQRHGVLQDAVNQRGVRIQSNEFCFFIVFFYNVKFPPDLKLEVQALFFGRGVETFQGRIFLRGSSQGESSVMRVRLEGGKKTHYNMH